MTATSGFTDKLIVKKAYAAEYEKQAYQFLSTYRFLSYGLAVLFSQVTFFTARTQISEPQMIVILFTLGIYSILKVFSPFRWKEKGTTTYVMLIADFIICLLLVLSTHSINSVFLLYSLTPVMTAALFFEKKLTLLLASISVLLFSLSPLLITQYGGTSWFTQENNLTILVFYTVFSFIISTVPYYINLNIRRRIKHEAILEERHRMGREIHDGIAQSLSYVNMKTRLVKKTVSANDIEQAVLELEEIRQIVQDCYEDIRESIDQLSNEKIDLPLIDTLRRLFDEFQKNNNIETQFIVSKSFPDLSPVAELQLLRIVQEGLTNVRKHASATKVILNLDHDMQFVEMILQDNGQGFEVNAPDAVLSGHYGLNIMKERAAELGGTINIISSQGKGTAIHVNLPVEKVKF